MKALVTGANGFIGSHLCECLLEQGHEVAGLVRTTSDLRWLKGLKVELRQGSLEDRASLAAAARGADWVFHTAASLRPKRREDYVRVNAEGTRMLAEVCAEAGTGRFVLFSSLAAAGPAESRDRPVTESGEPRPVSDYGRGKLAAERVLGAMKDRPASAILRFPAVYGPRDRDGLALFTAVRRGLRLVLGRFLSLVYVKDAVRAAVLAAERGSGSGRVYFVSDGECHDFDALARTAARLMGRRTVRVRPPRWALRPAAAAAQWLSREGSILNRDKARELAHDCWVCDPARARAELGFVPGYSLEQGLSETVRWYEENGWL
ncbi:MAG TPA: NAD-dependent epimerase/dehydratase family protein [candidate division WOR-3 bacterium]|uniref:NAD-dependent epimerase/dehydratase family protein n=1 Tax=candidate division WOR-3 bacterium TaxID=2052148 RepID=A0A7V0T639_UNCW3|nr:NAD-dependent epimerase/dehydratase family protein [candidate division WOR-3 bacterium]